MEDAEVIDAWEWRRLELDAELRALLLNGEADTPQADVLRDKIAETTEWPSCSSLRP